MRPYRRRKTSIVFAEPGGFGKGAFILNIIFTKPFQQGTGLFKLRVNEREAFFRFSIPEKNNCIRNGDRAMKSDSFGASNQPRRASRPLSVIVYSFLLGPRPARSRLFRLDHPS
jgi:hypothetical protein